MTNAEPTRDRVRGVLVGLAAGDRIGGPVRMALRVAGSLVERSAFDPVDVLDRHLGWWREGAFDTGPTADEVLALVDAGVDPRAAVEQVHEVSGGMTAGCNPAHRCPPLAMAVFVPEEDLADCARTEARLTHFDPLAGEVAAAVAVLCRALIRGITWDEALALAGKGRSDRAERALSLDDPSPLSPGGFAPETLRSAIHFVSAGESFGEALDNSIDFAGLANYCPVLVGAIGGARWGASSIPERALNHCEILPQVREVGDKLAAGW